MPVTGTAAMAPQVKPAFTGKRPVRKAAPTRRRSSSNASLGNKPAK